MKIIPILLSCLVLTSCSERNSKSGSDASQVDSSDSKVYSAITWDGKWEDGTGFWLKISLNGEAMNFARSGEQVDSPTKFTVESISKDFTVLTIIEKSDSVHYRHTLTLVSPKKLKRTSFDIDENAMWGEDVLTKS